MLAIVKTMGWPFSLIYILLLIGLAYFTFIYAPKALQTNQWVETQGRVIDNALSVSNKQHPRKQERISVYTINVQYEYFVNGNSYTGTYKKLTDHVKNSEKIKNALQNQYSIGASIPVFYNPNQVNKSVLQKGLTSIHYVIGLTLIMGLIVMSFITFRQMH